ncbi:glucosamine-6-phosphate deaminase [Bacillus coahuilensis m2-6]|uniref:glucosamine-6-phosphate deaminase n=1 Tax=Bacillus coahuilensis TaxID=408580 RepID=UPI00075021E7|nr:glucosamine-6-phosphate deaminase [Bacillus coahuilensis]KUP05412.1 glucosamine-6-phosphate deaminase [Bacillus coahuilensis m2-6]
MKLVEAPDYMSMSKQAADYIATRVREEPTMTLGLATGGTPLQTYRYLIQDYENKETSYQHVQTFNLDEYLGLPKDHHNSYYTYMKQNLFDHIHIPPSHTHIPNGMCTDVAQECEMYEKKLGSAGGMDLQILGIGENGHIGFNEPGTSFLSTTHLVKLTESTRKANSRYFSSMSEVPTHAITMGIQSIMKSKEIVLLVSGERKSAALRRLMNKEVSEEFPASALCQHKNVKIFADHEALG